MPVSSASSNPTLIFPTADGPNMITNFILNFTANAQINPPLARPLHAFVGRGLRRRLRRSSILSPCAYPLQDAHLLPFKLSVAQHILLCEIDGELQVAAVDAPVSAHAAHADAEHAFPLRHLAQPEGV